jgi:hypothetical protein
MTALPDARETLLLRAALGDGPAALADWERWRALVPLDDAPGDSVGLIPLLYRNLRRLGVDAAATARYAGVYRHSWAANRLAFRATAEVLAALGDAGIETLVLKGAALALGHYRDAGARPMSDVDVMVPRGRVAEARGVLATAGYAMTGSERELALGHSVPFVDARGRNLDLHWHISGEARQPGADEPFWRAAVPLAVEGVATRALAPTDLLYHVIEHAHASNNAHLRWAADAVTVLRGGGIDWARLIAHARARRMVLAVRAALGWLRDALGAGVPDAPIAELEAAPIAWVDRLEYHGRLSANPYSFGRILVRLWCQHRRASPARGLGLAAGFPGYLGAYYDVDSPWRLPALGLRRGLRRIRSHGLL